MPGVGWLPDLISIRPALGRLLFSAWDTCDYNVSMYNSIHTSATVHKCTCFYKCSTYIYFILAVATLSRVSFLLLYIVICFMYILFTTAYWYNHCIFDVYKA